jgi:SAM-dependent methyltransferase
MPENDHWFQHWFNKDYLNLYSYRNPEEAAKHVNFLVKALQLHKGESILDLGCGKGRHSLLLAKKGFIVTGVDLSSVLIEEGKNELNNYPNLKATLIAEDMFELKNLGVFDVVINLFTSFGYFEQDIKNEQFFEVVKTHLKPKGKFFLDFLHPAQVKRGLVDFEVRWIHGEKVDISKAIEGDRIVKTIVFNNPKRTYQEKIKLYSREQIEKMIYSHSLTIVNVWNDYNGNPWREDGDRQLFYCIRKE